MGIIKRAGDLVYTFRFLTLLVTPFNKTKAFELGIIDANGNRNKDFSMSTIDNRNAFKEYYTPFHRLVFNVKRLMSKAPGGSSRVASYAAALYLIKENYSVSEKKILKGLAEMGIDSTDMLVEESEWFLLESGQLSPGAYSLKNEKIIEDIDMTVPKGSKIKVAEDSFPVGDVFGINIYEATHSRTNKKVYITSSEIVR
jgi:hypothetical protein